MTLLSELDPRTFPYFAFHTDDVYRSIYPRRPTGRRKPEKPLACLSCYIYLFVRSLPDLPAYTYGCRYLFQPPCSSITSHSWLAISQSVHLAIWPAKRIHQPACHLTSSKRHVWRCQKVHHKSGARVNQPVPSWRMSPRTNWATPLSS